MLLKVLVQEILSFYSIISQISMLFPCYFMLYTSVKLHGGIRQGNFVGGPVTSEFFFLRKSFFF